MINKSAVFIYIIVRKGVIIMNFDFKKISEQFQIEGEMVSCEPYGEGHINLTFLLITTKAKYILQRVNNSIFKNPEKLMENIAGVTEYLRKIIKRVSVGIEKIRCNKRAFSIG